MELTQERLKELLSYDPLTGVFVWHEREIRAGSERTDKSWNSKYAGKQAGQVYGPDGLERVRISVDKVRYLAHRLAWLWMTGSWPNKEIDHKDMDPLNNKWSNLREATHSQNAMNRRGRSKYAKGVTIHRPSGLFQVRIHSNKVCKSLGYFKTIEAASAAYTTAAQKIHGEFARVA